MSHTFLDFVNRPQRILRNPFGSCDGFRTDALILRRFSSRPLQCRHPRTLDFHLFPIPHARKCVCTDSVSPVLLSTSFHITLAVTSMTSSAPTARSRGSTFWPMSHTFWDRARPPCNADTPSSGYRHQIRSFELFFCSFGRRPSHCCGSLMLALGAAYVVCFVRMSASSALCRQVACLREPCVDPNHLQEGPDLWRQPAVVSRTLPRTRRRLAADACKLPKASLSRLSRRRRRLRQSSRGRCW